MDSGTPTPPHALGTVLLGETHSAGAPATPIVSATFIPDSSALTSCSTKIQGCTVTYEATCGNGCAPDETCTLDASCNGTCTKACTMACASDEECYFPAPGSQACRKKETFTAGVLAFAGTTVPITLYPPYSFTPSGTGAPFLAGAQLEVQASGATDVGFTGFDEKFTSTTFLQTNPPLDTLALTTVFGSGPLTLGWAPGQDTILVSVTGPNGTAQCTGTDSAGTLDVPRAAINAVTGGSTSLSITVSRIRTEERTGEHTKGQMLTAKVQPIAWLDLTTMSSETASFQGCATGQMLCPDGCFDTQSDPLHCGTCTNACSPGAFCDLGQCVGGGTDGGVDSGQACGACEQNVDTLQCASQYTACLNDAFCYPLLSCANTCTDSSCVTICEQQNPQTSNAWANLDSCYCGVCANACPALCL